MYYSGYVLVLLNIQFSGIYGADEDRVVVKGGEFCEFDTFEAICGPGEVIQMEAAQYGRMRLGKCVLSDLGFVGCSADVLDLVDARCSGKRKCSIKMPDERIAARKPCMTELKMYLEANYTCKKVVLPAESVCSSCESIRLNEPSGMISSTLTRQSGCGAAKCPWLLASDPGQHIDIWLVNYGWGQADDSCQVYAIIKELGQTNAPETVCASKQRYHHVYTSTSHVVELRIVTGKIKPDQTEFLIKYKFTGCKQLSAPAGGWMQRDDDVIRMGCNNTGVTWSLRCDGSEWRGESQQCPGYGSPPGDPRQMQVKIPSVLSMVIIIAVAFVVGAFILCIGVIMFKRRYMMRSLPQETMYPVSKQVTSPPVGKDSIYSPPLYNQGSRDPDSAYQQAPYRSDNYTPIWERPLPNPNQDNNCSCPDDRAIGYNTMSCPAGGNGTTCSAGNVLDNNRRVAKESEYNSLASVSDVISATAAHTDNKRGMVYGNNTMARKEYELPSSDSDNDSRYYQVDPQ